jgi:hypothetical protein
MAQCGGQIDYGVEKLIVAGGRERKLGTDGRFLSPGVAPPEALEVENSEVALAEG